MKRGAILRSRFVGMASVAIGVVLLCPFRLGVVWGRSMAPTYEPGEICVLDRSYEPAQDMKRGDIIVFHHGDELYTKRVYGAPGSTITLLQYTSDGSFELPPTFNEARLRRIMPRKSGYVRVVNLKIPRDRCFVLGDNLSASYDSRQFGPVDVDTVIGRMVTHFNYRQARAAR